MTDAGEGFYDFMVETNDRELALKTAMKYVKGDGARPVTEDEYTFSTKPDPHTD